MDCVSWCWCCTQPLQADLPGAGKVSLHSASTDTQCPAAIAPAPTDSGGCDSHAFHPILADYAHLEWVESLEGIFLLFGPGSIAYVNALMLVPVFRSYIPEEQQEA